MNIQLKEDESLWQLVALAGALGFSSSIETAGIAALQFEAIEFLKTKNINFINTNFNLFTQG